MISSFKREHIEIFLTDIDAWLAVWGHWNRVKKGAAKGFGGTGSYFCEPVDAPDISDDAAMIISEAHAALSNPNSFNAVFNGYMSQSLRSYYIDDVGYNGTAVVLGRLFREQLTKDFIDSHASRPTHKGKKVLSHSEIAKIKCSKAKAFEITKCAKVWMQGYFSRLLEEAA